MDPLVAAESFPGCRRITYLNTASVALVPADAIEAMGSWQARLGETGTLDFDEAAERSVFEPVRAAAARLLGASPADVAVGSSATELLSSLAWAVLPAGGRNVVGVDSSFPSTMYPWARVARATGAEVRLVAAADGRVETDDLIAAIDATTAVVCVSHVDYRSGQRLDLARLAEASHAAGALLVVDATQSAGAVPIDFAACGADVMVTSGYKWLCGPFGVALLLVAAPLRGRLDPGVVGFRSHHDMWDLDARRLRLPDAARRFEASTMAYGCAIGLERSLSLLTSVGIERIHAHGVALAGELSDELQRRGVDVVWPTVDVERTAIVSARLPDRDTGALARRLADRRVVVSPRGDVVRFSPHLYNGSADVARALDELDRILEEREPC